MVFLSTLRDVGLVPGWSLRPNFIVVQQLLGRRQLHRRRLHLRPELRRRDGWRSYRRRVYRARGWIGRDRGHRCRRDPRLVTVGRLADAENANVVQGISAITTAVRFGFGSGRAYKDANGRQRP